MTQRLSKERSRLTVSRKATEMKEPETPMEWIKAGLVFGATFGVAIAAICAVLAGAAFTVFLVVSAVTWLFS